MRDAAPRDMVARQYAKNFRHVLGLPCRGSARDSDSGWSLAEAVIHVQMRLMAEHPDSLIARKCGPDVAQEASARAAAVLAAEAREMKITNGPWPISISGSAATATAATLGPRPT